MTVPKGVVLVAIDGSPGSAGAIAFGVEEARRRQATLRLLHVWHAPTLLGGGQWILPPEIEARIGGSVQELVAAAAAAAAELDPELEVSADAVQGPVIPTIVAASAEADILIVGSRGHGGFAELVLGSVSQGAAQHAHCPVTIVRAAEGANRS